MRARLFQLRLDARRNERIGVNLTVWMMERDADGLALVLEDEDVFNKFKRAQFTEAIRPYLNQFVNLRDGLGGQRRSMIRRIENNFADALSGTHRVKFRSFDGGRGRVRSERRKAILKGHYVISAFWNFRRKAARLRRTKRAVVCGRQECSI